MKYWLYKDSEISGPFAADDQESWRGLSSESLVCPEGTGGAQENDWVGVMDVPELSWAVRSPTGEFDAGMTATAVADLPVDLITSIPEGPVDALSPIGAEPPVSPEAKASLLEWVAQYQRDVGEDRLKSIELEAKIASLTNQIALYEVRQNQILDRFQEKETQLQNKQSQLDEKDRTILALQEQLARVSERLAKQIPGFMTPLAAAVIEPPSTAPTPVPIIAPPALKPLPASPVLPLSITPTLAPTSLPTEAPMSAAPAPAIVQPVDVPKMDLPKPVELPPLRKEERPAVALPQIQPAQALAPVAGILEFRPFSPPQPPEGSASTVMSAPLSFVANTPAATSPETMVFAPVVSMTEPAQAAVSPAPSATPPPIQVRGTADPSAPVSEPPPAVFTDLSAESEAQPPLTIVIRTPGTEQAPAPGAPTPAPRPMDAPSGYTPQPSVEAPAPGFGGLKRFVFSNPTPIPTAVSGDAAASAADASAIVRPDIGVLTRGKKPQAQAADGDLVEQKPKRGTPKSFFIILGVSFAMIVMIGAYFMRRDPKEIAEMFAMRPKRHPVADPDEMLGKSASLGSVSPSPAAQSPAFPSTPGQAAASAQGNPAVPQPAPNQNEKAVDFVKQYVLDGGRGTIAQWLQYSFGSVQGEEDWSSQPNNVGHYLVYYNFYKGGKSAPGVQPITYIFEADLAQGMLAGYNDMAKALLAAPAAPPKPAPSKPAKPKAAKKAKPKPVKPKRKPQPALKPGELPLLPLPDLPAAQPQFPDEQSGGSDL